jgi:hypothetical protein
VLEVRRQTSRDWVYVKWGFVGASSIPITQESHGIISLSGPFEGYTAHHPPSTDFDRGETVAPSLAGEDHISKFSVTPNPNAFHCRATSPGGVNVSKVWTLCDSAGGAIRFVPGSAEYGSEPLYEDRNDSSWH